MTARKDAKQAFLAELNVVLESVNFEIEKDDQVQFCIATSKDVILAEQQWLDRRVGWSWEVLHAKVKSKTREVLLSIRDLSTDRLVGLLVFRVTKGRVHTKLLYVEKERAFDAIKILKPSLYLLDSMAIVFNTAYACIENPLPDLIVKYQEYGFVPEYCGHHHGRKVVRRLSKSRLEGVTNE